MKSEEAIKKRIDEIEADTRFKSGQSHPATIDVNAPLALVQLSFEEERKALKWVLKGG